MHIKKSVIPVLIFVVFLVMMLGNTRSVSTMDQQNGNTITFEKHTISTNNPGSTQVNAADVDGDGDQDILSVSASDDKVIWFENIGGIPPDFVTHVITDQADLAHSVHAADIDGDTDLDILSANGWDGSIEWYENDGLSSPTFTNHTISNDTPDAKFVYATDADGDGDIDVFSASRGDNKIAWYENDGGLAPSFTAHVISTSAIGANMVYATDLDDDGDVDALSASRFDDKIAWYENDGNSPPNFISRIITTNADDAFTVYAKDINGDGHVDVLSISETDRKIAWYENDGSSPPNFTSHIITTAINAPIAVYAADLDNDGDNDVLSGSHVDGVSWHENKGGVLPDFETHVIQDGGMNRWVHVEDLDDDGDLDIISGNWLEQSVDWWENKLVTGTDNTAPILTVDESHVEVNEGLVALNSGLIEDADGDAVALDVSVGTIINNPDGAWSWSIVTDDGPEQSQIVTISADDGNGGLSESIFQLSVNNVAPTITSLIAPEGPVNINEQPVSLQVAFTDPGILDTHDVTWDWGDGISEVKTGATSPAVGGHIYAETGTYTIEVTVTDKDSGSDSQTFEYVVIYDPEGGFVTGGGWIYSEAGWCQLDDLCAGAEGKANFGFVSKYKKGASVPTGNTEFNFKAGGLKFHSSSYDWLVVNQNGENAQYKGKGTINGEGDYKFMLWAGDKEPDTFRIKIWADIEEGVEEIIYDNGFNQAIGGGNIVLHTGK